MFDLLSAGLAKDDGAWPTLKLETPRGQTAEGRPDYLNVRSARHLANGSSDRPQREMRASKVN
jgi:hypothetical protein